MLKVSIDLSQLDLMTERAKAAADRAVHQLAIEAGKQWAEAILSANIHNKIDYAKSLRIERYGWADYVISASYPQAKEIEEGRPAKDLKRMLQTSTKTRQGRNGKYLIIPMRSNTTGNTAHARAMPPHVYARAKTLEPSRLLAPGSKMPAQRLSASGHLVAQHSYEWGGRLPSGMAPKLKPSHATDPFAGMVKMGEGNSSRAAGYMTFRTMSESQNGKWLIPQKPGLHLARGVADQIGRIAPQFIRNCIAESLK